MRYLFIKNNQPFALEFLGYAICLYAGFLIFLGGEFNNWETYVYAVLVMCILGAVYRLCIAYYQEIIDLIQKAYEKLTIYLCRLAGKRKLVQDVEKTKYAVIGASLFIPPMMAFYAFPFFLQSSLGFSAGLSYLLTIPLAFVIFLVDRSFVATMGWKKIWYGVAARMILAIAMGLMLSKPIELQLFQKETTEELRYQREQKLLNLETAYFSRRANILNEDSLGKREMNRARKEYEDEINKSIAGRRAGHGKEADKKEAYFKEQEALYWQNVAPITQARLDDARADYEEKKHEYIATQSDGLGARAQALEAAGKKYPAVGFMHYLFLITLVLLDLSPLLAKILMPKTISDRQEQAEEEEWEHENNKKKIARRYELINQELIGSQELLAGLGLPQDQQETLAHHHRTKLIRSLLGEDALLKVNPRNN